MPVPGSLQFWACKLQCYTATNNIRRPSDPGLKIQDSWRSYLAYSSGTFHSVHEPSSLKQGEPSVTRSSSSSRFPLHLNVSTPHTLQWPPRPPACCVPEEGSQWQGRGGQHVLQVSGLWARVPMLRDGLRACDRRPGDGNPEPNMAASRWFERQTDGSDRERREVDLGGKEFEPDLIPPEWNQWLRRTRVEPPSEEDIAKCVVLGELEFRGRCHSCGCACRPCPWEGSALPWPPC